MKRKSIFSSRKLLLVWLGLTIPLGCGTYALHAQMRLTTMRLDGPMVGAAVSPDGRYIAVNMGHSAQRKDGSWNSTEWVEIIEPSSSKVVARVDIPSAALLKDAPLSSTDGFIGYCDNGKYLAAYDLIGTVYVLNTDTYRIEAKINLGIVRGQDSQGTVLGMTMACSAGGGVFAVSAFGGRFGRGVVRVFDLATGKQTGELDQNASTGEQFAAIDLSPSGSKIAILLANPKGKGLKGPNVEVLDTKKMRLVNSFSTGAAPRGLAFAGESELITIQGPPSRPRSKQVLCMWNLESGKEERQFSDARVSVDWPISSSADGNTILGYLPTYRECLFCNGLEGRRTVKKQQFAVWDKSTGAEIFRSEPFSPIVEPLGPQCVLSQDGTVVMVYWPDSVITPRLFPIRRAGQ